MNCHSKNPCGYLSEGNCSFTGKCYYHEKHDTGFERLSDIDISNIWKGSERLTKAREHALKSAVLNSYTITEKEELCTIHNVKTIPAMLGLWVCPTCARIERGHSVKRSEEKVRLPYRDDDPVEAIDETDDFNF